MVAYVIDGSDCLRRAAWSGYELPGLDGGVGAGPDIERLEQLVGLRC